MVEGNFIQKKKNQKNMLFILVIVLVVILFVIYNGFFKSEPAQEELPKEEMFISKPEIKINFNILEDLVLKELEPFFEIQPLELATGTELGRENPFTPF